MLELEGKCRNGYLDYTCPSVHYTLASCATKHDLRKLCLDLILVDCVDDSDMLVYDCMGIHDSSMCYSMTPLLS